MSVKKDTVTSIDPKGLDDAILANGQPEVLGEAGYTEYLQNQKNTVNAMQQLNQEGPIRVYNPAGKGKRIMFAGNSITLHGKKEDIGWHGDWGMAASCAENDYFHRLMSAIQKKDPDSVFCICQVSQWERQYKDGMSLHPLLKKARDFNADIIVTRFVENCPVDAFDKEVFKTEMAALLHYLDLSEKANMIFTTGFWHHPADVGVIELAEKWNVPLVKLGDLGERDDMKAIGLFAHTGVANHPGNLGMQIIADRIFEILKNYL